MPDFQFPERFPACPQCQSRGIRVKPDKDWFRCSDTDCNGIWKERDWDMRVAKERQDIRESLVMNTISGCLATGDEILCDECGRTIRHGEKYAIKHDEIIDSVDDLNRIVKRQKRYCKYCAYRYGWFKIIRDGDNVEQYVLFVFSTDTLL
jgi:hypothetical protein